jgi:hypothetical protein
MKFVPTTNTVTGLSAQQMREFPRYSIMVLKLHASP